MQRQHRRLWGRWLYVAAALYSNVAVAGEQSWKTIAMSDGISLQYPPTWWPISVSGKRVDLLSSKGGAEGVVIQQNQAEIITSVVARSSSSSFDEFIASNLGNQTVLSREEIASAGPAGCSRLHQVISREEEGPGAYVANTGIFCEIGTARVIVLLRNWENDNQQKHYQHMALRMARSIRAAQASATPRGP